MFLVCQFFTIMTTQYNRRVVNHSKLGQYFFVVSDTSTGIEYPGSSCINAVTELMAEIEADAVAAVIFVGEPSALVDGTVLKTVIGLG